MVVLLCQTDSCDTSRRGELPRPRTIVRVETTTSPRPRGRPGGGRERILDVACELISSHGMDEVRVARIAQRRRRLDGAGALPLRNPRGPAGRGAAPFLRARRRGAHRTARGRRRVLGAAARGHDRALPAAAGQARARVGAVGRAVAARGPPSAAAGRRPRALRAPARVVRRRDRRGRGAGRVRGRRRRRRDRRAARRDRRDRRARARGRSRAAARARARAAAPLASRELGAVVR